MTELLFWCQQKLVINLTGHPVFRKIGAILWLTTDPEVNTQNNFLIGATANNIEMGQADIWYKTNSPTFPAIVLNLTNK